MSLVTISQPPGRGGAESAHREADRLAYRSLGGIPHALEGRIVAPLGVRSDRVARKLAESGQSPSHDAIRYPDVEAR